MTMSRTQLLMSRILGRGAQLDPNEEVVTLMPNGTHRQTLKATWQRANQVAGALSAMGIQEQLPTFRAIPSRAVDGRGSAYSEHSFGRSGP